MVGGRSLQVAGYRYGQAMLIAINAGPARKS